MHCARCAGAQHCADFPPPPPMSNSAPARVRNPDELDPRVARSTRALGAALIALVQERDFDDITVQDILDRAGVGRATFYAHFRNKQDALHSSYDHLFAGLERMLARPSALGPRLLPVTELLAHFGESRPLADALRRGGQLDDFCDLLTEHAVRLVERRMAAWPDGAVPAAPRPVVARMLAGAFVESMRWWLDHPGAASPGEMDAAFHGLARGMVRRVPAGGGVTA